MQQSAHREAGITQSLRRRGAGGTVQMLGGGIAARAGARREPARALAAAGRHRRSDPFYAPLAPASLGLAHHMLKKYSQALPPLQECVARAPNLQIGHLWLAATYAQLRARSNKLGQRPPRSCASIPRGQASGQRGAYTFSNVPRTPSTFSTACAKRGCRKSDALDLQLWVNSAPRSGAGAETRPTPPA